MTIGCIIDSKPGLPGVFNSAWAGSDLIYSAISALIAYKVVTMITDTSSTPETPGFAIVGGMPMLQAPTEPVTAISDDAIQLSLLAGAEGGWSVLESTITTVEPTLIAPHHAMSPILMYATESSCESWAGLRLQLALYFIGERLAVLAPTSLLLQMSICLALVTVVCTVYLSYYSNGREEWQSDADYMVGGLSAEAEKELFALDDTSVLFLTIFFFFATYFGYFLSNGNYLYSEILCFLLPLPVAFFSLVAIPVNLIYDFGLFFIAYMRGASNTSSLFFELIYDYIGIIAFFTRLLVQFVRVALMFVVYCMMHDAVILFYVPYRAFLSGDSFWDELCSIQPTLYSITYFFVMALPSRVGYWIYEVLHTFFVVTVQFAAFFTIVFWLFLLFYSFFIFEEFECHFSDKRGVYKRLQARVEEAKSSGSGNDFLY